jgi:hypothetical protein
MPLHGKIQVVEAITTPAEMSRMVDEVMVPVDAVVVDRLPGYERAIILPESIQNVLVPGRETAHELGWVLGYEVENWAQLSEAIYDGLPTSEAVLASVGADMATEWETPMLVRGPNQRVCYMGVRWLAPSKGAPTFITATVEQSARNEQLIEFGVRARGPDPLLLQRASGLVA